jgi:hypothetical protein
MLDFVYLDFFVVYYFNKVINTLFLFTKVLVHKKSFLNNNVLLSNLYNLYNLLVLLILT